MKGTFLLIITLVILRFTSHSQSYDKLDRLSDDSIHVYYSKGQQQRAKSISARMKKAMNYHQQLLEFRPDVTILILKEADWFDYTSFPVYGMPHYNGNKLLVVAAEDNAFWKSFIPPLHQLTEAMKQQIQKVYSLEDGTISMEPFFDLLALHELGHAFHFQSDLNMQRKWMGELFSNVFLHTYIAEKEPQSLPALTLFPQMVINNGTKEFLYTRLQDIEERYDEIGKQHAKNYGWYQSRWHAAAATIFETAGKEAIRKIWDALKSKSGTLADDQLLNLFESAGVSAVADMMRNWDGDTKK